MENESLPYNVLTGILPECLQMDTISEILSSKLRKLPLNECQQNPEIRIIAKKLDDGKFKEKVIWHIGRKKRFLKKGIGLKKRIASVLLFNLF
ncbi:MAG: hypothetical protein PHO02_00505 [Candidatus Nanoarchaeia archaeon]|nr:hypothetical protein [Candidatus Nanoarchaeia archaeon]